MTLKQLYRFFITDYFARHKNNANKFLHLIGIGLVLFAVYAFFRGRWQAGALSFFMGYLFQWMGHAVFEKNEVGEWVIIKKAAKRLLRG